MPAARGRLAARALARSADGKDRALAAMLLGVVSATGEGRVSPATGEPTDMIGPDEDPWVRCAALGALRHVGGDAPGALARLLPLVSTRSPRSGSTSPRGLGVAVRGSSADDRVNAALATLIGDEDPEVARESMAAVGPAMHGIGEDVGAALRARPARARPLDRPRLTRARVATCPLGPTATSGACAGR